MTWGGFEPPIIVNWFLKLLSIIGTNFGQATSGFLTNPIANSVLRNVAVFWLQWKDCMFSKNWESLFSFWDQSLDMTTLNISSLYGYCTVLNFHNFSLKYRSERAFLICDFRPKTLYFWPKWIILNIKCPILDQKCPIMGQNSKNIKFLERRQIAGKIKHGVLLKRGHLESRVMSLLMRIMTHDHFDKLITIAKHFPFSDLNCWNHKVIKHDLY